MWSLPIIAGLLCAGVIIILLEILGCDKRSAGSLILTGIGFIYLLFAGDDLVLLSLTALQSLVFWKLAYDGLQKHALLIPLGLMLHAGWDLGYFYLAEDGGSVPAGYELFCVVVDLVLAGWFYFSFRRESN